MTSLLLHKKFQIRLIVRSKLFVHKKVECKSGFLLGSCLYIPWDRLLNVMEQLTFSPDKNTGRSDRRLMVTSILDQSAYKSLSYSNVGFVS